MSDLPFEGLEISPAADNVPPRGRIFLSRSSQDRAVAQKLIPELQALGYEVWAQDKDINIGDSFRLFMDRALKECSATVALLSGDYLKSQWCRDEAVSAHRMDSHILIPLVIEEGLKPDGLIASFVYLDVVVKLSGAPATVARLIAEVLAHGKPLDQSPPARPYLQHSRYITNIPFDDTALLVGRDAAIEKLDAILNKPGDANAVAVTAGMGGVGKSWLARVYAVRNRMAYRGVWLVRCENPADTVEDLASLGEELDEGLKGANDRPAVARHTLKLIRQDTGRRILLIYDNVETPDAIREWLPLAGARVVLTSRWSDWTGTSAKAVPLETLSRNSAIALLRDQAPNVSEEDANAIAEALGDLPLALSHSAAVLRRSGLSAEQYLRDLSRRLKERPKGGDYPASVRAALESNLEQVARESPDAASILQLAAFCAPDDIPIELWETEDAKSLLPVGLHDEIALRETMGSLEAWSLLRVDRDSALGWTTTIHRLVQQVVQSQQQEAGKAESLAAIVVEAMNNLYPGGEGTRNPADVRSWPICSRYQSHAENALAHVSNAEAPVGAARLLNQLGQYRKARAEHRAAEPLMRRALSLDEAKFGPSHPEVATDLANLGTLLQATNRVAEAEPLMRRALAIDEAYYGHDHARVGTHLNNLGQLLRATNRLADAEPIMRRALAIGEANHGPDHPTVAIRLGNLAALLQATNHVAEAEPLMRRALAIDEASHGPDHPRVAAHLNNLAQLLRLTNRLAEAEPLMLRALAISEASYGPSHPEVAIRLNNLATLLQHTNRFAEAEPLMRRALAIDEASYGPDHPSVASRLNNLATLLGDTNRLEEAEPLMRRALAIDEASLGPHHPMVAIRIGNLAGMLQDSGRALSALPLRIREFQIMSASFEESHPYRQTATGNLANCILQLDHEGLLPPEFRELADDLKAGKRD